MRAIVQRVSEASIDIGGNQTAKVGPGLVLLVGIRKNDTPADASRLADRIVGLRIFEDAEGKMNHSLDQIEPRGEILLVSNFTVYGDVWKSRRPSFTESAPFQEASLLFDTVKSEFIKRGYSIQTGVFGTDMKVKLVNDGPVTLIVDTN